MLSVVVVSDTTSVSLDPLNLTYVTYKSPVIQTNEYNNMDLPLPLLVCAIIAGVCLCLWMLCICNCVMPCCLCKALGSLCPKVAESDEPNREYGSYYSSRYCVNNNTRGSPLNSHDDISNLEVIHSEATTFSCGEKSTRQSVCTI